MNFTLLSWLFALAITVHNLEEAIWLPAWSQSARRWHHPVGVREFRFAVAILTFLAYLAAYLSMIGRKGSPAAYILEGYALAMLLNVVFPHLLATFILKRYTPGTATALFLNLPITSLLLYQGIKEGYIVLPKFFILGPLVVLGIVAFIPVLFIAGRKLTSLFDRLASRTGSRP